MIKSPFFRKFKNWDKNVGTVELPKRVILIRHGKSNANHNPKVWSYTPDYKVELYKGEFERAIEVGKRLKNLLNDETTFWFVSPYVRSWQTFLGLVKAFGGVENVNWREEPRLREQEWGNLQTYDVEKKMKERREFGSFYYRFPDGESGADVYNRISTFLNTLVRRMEKGLSENIIIVSHVYTCRCFLARYFRIPVILLQNMWNFETLQHVTLSQAIVKNKYGEKVKKYRMDGVLRINKKSIVKDYGFNDIINPKMLASSFIPSEKVTCKEQFRKRICYTFQGELRICDHYVFYGKSFLHQIGIDDEEERILDFVLGFSAGLYCSSVNKFSIQFLKNRREIFVPSKCLLFIS